jgi:hypothetical protein
MTKPQLRAMSAELASRGNNASYDGPPESSGVAHLWMFSNKHDQALISLHEIVVHALNAGLVDSEELLREKIAFLHTVALMPDSGRCVLDL